MYGLTTIAMAVAAANFAVEPQAMARPADPPPVAKHGMNTTFGPTGLITTPTAFVTPKGHVNFGSHFARDTRGPSANWGITEGVEVGGTYVDRSSGSNKFIGNAKVHIVPANFTWFDLGIGVIDAAKAIDQTFYFVGTASLRVPEALEGDAIGLRVHAGVGTGMFQEKIFGGAEVFVTRRIALIGEWDTRDFNAAIRYVHDDSFRVQAGLQNTNFFLSATYGLRF